MTDQVSFIIHDGRAPLNRLADFPNSKFLVSSKLLVLGEATNGTTVAACGIRSSMNVLSVYVKKGFRAQRVGSRIMQETLNEARKRRLSFVTLTVSTDNIRALQLFFKTGFRKIACVEERGLMVMVFAVNLKGRSLFAFWHVLGSLLPDEIIKRIHLRLGRMSFDA